jgi:succinoglycan biosynthesis transport protein ExoP
MSSVQIQNSVVATDDLIDLQAMINVVFRRLWTLLAVSGLVFTVVALVTLQATPTYTATSQVALDAPQSRIVDFDAVLTGRAPDSAMMDTEVVVFNSNRLAGVVVDELNLVDVPEFNSALRAPSFLSEVRSTVTGWITSMSPQQTQPDIQRETTEYERERVIASLMSHVSIDRAGVSYLIDVSATSWSPSLARDIANTFVEAYLDAQLEQKFAATERANAWLNDRVEVLREEVRTRETAVAEYRESAGLLDAEGASLTEQQISDVNAQLVMQRAALAEAEARLRNVRDQIERGVSAETIAEVLRSEVIRDLRQRQADVTRRRGELSTRYGPRHPQMVTVIREQSDLDRQIDQEVARIVANLSNEADIARQRVRSLSGSLGRLRRDLGVNYNAIVRLRELEREADASRTMFQSILTRYQQTSEQVSLTESDARVVSTASRPLDPSAPDVGMSLLTGLALGIAAGFGTILLLEMLRTGLHTDVDVESKLDMPHLASVPLLKFNALSRLVTGVSTPSDYVVKKPMSAFAESIRAIRSSINLASADGPAQIIVVTSALPDEGKTTTSICLGKIAAMAESRAIVIDCDLRRKRLSAELCPNAKQGWLEAMNGSVKFSSVMKTDKKTGMAILPLGRGKFSPRDVFGSASFERMLDALRQNYDLIILDSAPVLAVADSLDLASRVDAVVFQSAWKKTKAGVAKTALANLAKVRANILGVVLTRVNLKEQSKYGGSAYGAYYQGYQQYYNQ